MADVTVIRTWDLRHQFHETWLAQPLLRVEDCGCIRDRMDNDVIWEPCMAHEGEGHLAALSEQDGLHVARCLVLSCAWSESWLRENDAISAAQTHWLTTRDS